MKNAIAIGLRVDDQGSPVINKFTKTTVDKVKKMSDRSSRHVQALSGKFTAGLGGAISKVAGMLTNLKTLAIGALAGWGIKTLIADWVGLANVQEKAETKLAAVLKSTGQAAGYNAQQLKDMAARMQAITTVGDEVTINGMAMLATFKQIKGEAFEGATKAAMNMSQVMDQDLKSSIVMIGKALNDPIANLSAMTRTGVQFTKQQKDMIKALWEAGDAAGAQAVILQELDSQFGGAAEAARKTFAGAVTAAGNALGDLKEQLGAVITQNPFFINMAKEAENWFNRLGQTIVRNRDQLQEYSKDVGVRIVSSIKWMLSTGADLVTFFIENKKTIKSVVVEMGKFYAVTKVVGGLTAAVAFFNGMSAATALLAAKTVLLNKALKTSLPILAAYASYKVGEFIHDKVTGLGQIQQDIADSQALNERLKERLNQAQAKAAESLASGGESSGKTATDFAYEQIQGMIQAAQADKKLLQERLEAYEAFSTTIAEKIRQNAEQEKRHVQELIALYQQKADVQKSAETLISGLKQSLMDPEERYNSQKVALERQYYDALKLSGQERVRALETYKQGMASFANTYGKGLADAGGVIVSSEQIVQEAVANINWATKEQQSALEALALEKQRQIEADQEWGRALNATAMDVENTIVELKQTISGLSAQIESMQKTVDIQGIDNVTSVVRQIRSELDALRDKTVRITTITRSVGLMDGPGDGGDGSAGDASDTGAPATAKGSYRFGTRYVPATGMYQLHQGERVSRSGSAGGKSVTVGNININIPESSAPQRPEDWREITRTYIKPELERIS